MLPPLPFFELISSDTQTGRKVYTPLSGVTGPPMIQWPREGVDIPTIVFDLLYPPPDGFHSIPHDRFYYSDPGRDGIDFKTPDALQVELSHRRGPKPQWEPSVVRSLRERYWRGGKLLVKDVAEELGCPIGTASNLLFGKTYWWA